jgi:hypothetical protein
MMPIEWMQDELWRDALRDFVLAPGSRTFMGMDGPLTLNGKPYPKHPPRILEPGKNLYAPKVLVLIEKRSYDCMAPLLLESTRDAFKEYEYGQVYYALFNPNEPCGELVEDARIVGARLCYFMYRLDNMAWELRESGGGTLTKIHEHEAMMDRRFCRDRWRTDSRQAHALPSKPKLKEPCDCGLCDRCLELC